MAHKQTLFKQQSTCNNGLQTQQSTLKTGVGE